MKRYEFRLDQVLRVRRVQADEAAEQLRSSQRSETAALLAEMGRRHAISDRSRVRGACTSEDLLMSRVLWDAELDSLGRLEEHTQTAREEAAEHRSVWLAASQRVRALELVDEHRREEHRILADRAEARRIDDLVATRYTAEQARRRIG